jgi:hypothetical protein
MDDLPRLALSVRQPWAWAIVAGWKTVENRSAEAVRAGRMTRGQIAIHAASGLTRDEFRWGYWRLDRHGVRCPMPDCLPRRAIVGVVEVVDIVHQSDSAWFGGPLGLVLANARQIDPIPAGGALGYFEWAEAGAVAPPLAWMHRFDPLRDTGSQPGLFDALPMSFRDVPPRPWRKG